ncbi:hypothetical protein [Micromonospora sp. KC721]|uniref:hypothetical protein n=1 Tax=Micromonospora sp. KC721 TaxID=2530380 RepID=UPI00104B71D3|nr:hypothetical protein [Micromonospora sp. KC721]TDB77866.1 hypothetical protein E1182_16680 [Micromonospora sp. KC721]
MPQDYISDLPKDVQYEVFDLLPAEALINMLQTAKPITESIEKYFEKAEVIELMTGRPAIGKASDLLKGIGQGRYARSADSAEIVRSMTKSLTDFVIHETDKNSGVINWEKAADLQARFVADMARESVATDEDTLIRRSALETFIRSALKDERLVNEWDVVYTGGITDAIAEFAKGNIYFRVASG